MHYTSLDTPSLLIDQTRLLNNIRSMQAYADRQHVRLRPHTKTHKMPYIARLQLANGAHGIAVAKVQEALVMAEHGIEDIFIANQVIGEQKLAHIAGSEAHICFGLDSVTGIRQAQAVFSAAGRIASVLIEIEVGEKRAGVNHEQDMLVLLEELKHSPNVRLIGVYGHDGNTYGAPDREACLAIALDAQHKILHYAALARSHGFSIEHVSYGSTPPFLLEAPILTGITEIRPGTYALMDASQAAVLGDLSHCAATVLCTVMSLPTADRVVLDVGAKGLTMQERTRGITAVQGKGLVYDQSEVFIQNMYDEHALIENKAFRDRVQVGDRIRIIPVHICPVCNLYEQAYLLEGDRVVEILQVAARAKMG